MIQAYSNQEEIEKFTYYYYFHLEDLIKTVDKLRTISFQDYIVGDNVWDKMMSFFKHMPDSVLGPEICTYPIKKIIYGRSSYYHSSLIHPEAIIILEDKE